MATETFLAYLQEEDTLNIFEEYGFAPYTQEAAEGEEVPEEAAK